MNELPQRCARAGLFMIPRLSEVLWQGVFAKCFHNALSERAFVKCRCYHLDRKW